MTQIIISQKDKINKLKTNINTNKILIPAVLFLCLTFAKTQSLFSQNWDPNTYYRFTTKWLGEDISLDIINDGENDKLMMAKTGNYLGQFWKITPLESGYCRLTTKWQGDDKSLDVINDGLNDKLRLFKTGKYSGQAWKITPLGNGYYRLTTLFQGEGMSLDVINDGVNNKLKLAKTGEYSGQYWFIQPADQPVRPSSYIMPANWSRTGSEPQSYDMGNDKGAGPEGTSAATIKSISEKINGFGSLVQGCLPYNYLGKKVRMTGFMKTKDVFMWAGFWMRVDQANSQVPLSFDNLHDGKQDRSVTGTTDWTKYEIVLDVPQQASNIVFGALLVGTGQIWIDNLGFEVVDDSVPTTGKNTESNISLKEPENLDFEK